MLLVYGIKNCDTVKKALHWLEGNAIDYQFHDLRKDGLDEDKLQSWVNVVGWQCLLNTRGTTWRKLKQPLPMNNKEAIQLLLAHPALIKRPVIEGPKCLLIGFKLETYSQNLLTTATHHQEHRCNI